MQNHSPASTGHPQSRLMQDPLSTHCNWSTPNETEATRVKTQKRLCKRLRANALALIVSIAASSIASAQAPASPPPPGSPFSTAETPAVGDPEVAYMFLLHHASLVKEIRNLGTSNPAGGAAAKRSAAESMNLSVADFDAVTIVYSQIVPLLQIVDKEADRYRDNVLAGASTVDSAVLQQFSARRMAVKASIKQRLQAALSSASYATLNTYIEGRFRETVRIRRVK